MNERVRTMADDQHDIGEIWATVQQHGIAINRLGAQLETGFKSITDSINISHEKTDRQIRDLARETDTRISGVASDYRKSASERSQNILTFTGIFLASIIGFATLAVTAAGAVFTAYSLVKQPIDQSFQALNEVTRGIVADQKSMTAYIDKRLESYTPSKEIQTNIDVFKTVTASNTSRINELEKGSAVSLTNRKGIEEDVKRLDGDIHELRTSVKADFATRKETDVQFADQTARTNSIVMGLNDLRKALGDGNGFGDQIKALSDRLNSLQSKFIISPNSPFIDNTPPAK